MSTSWGRLFIGGILGLLQRPYVGTLGVSQECPHREAEKNIWPAADLHIDLLCTDALLQQRCKVNVVQRARQTFPT